MVILISFLAAAGLTALLARLPPRWQLLDHPNARSLHDRPIPRSGGLAIFAVVAFYLGGYGVHESFSGQHIGACIGLWMVAAIALVDDWRGVRPRWRLLVQLAAGALLVEAGARGLAVEPGWMSRIAATLAVVWMINLYNFMDGLDGLAGGMALIGFTSLGLLGMLAGVEAYMLVNLVIAAAAAGFLLFNYPPARIFMGDTGSYTLGYMAAVSSLWGIAGGVFPVWVPFLVFSPFIVDATVTLVRRAWHHEPVWSAHKSHYYQRLAESSDGAGRRTLLAEYALMSACGASAILALQWSVSAQYVLMGVWALAYAVLLRLISRHLGRQRSCRSS